MTQTVLIANRGEIACRVIRTARDMGFQTVAVYSDADRLMPHVRDADRAVHIGPSPAAQSYLVIDEIIAAAKKTGATMIHPGYGFLSENTAFAQACADNGIIFVGAPAAAIEAMGLKDAAKDLMQQAGVPVVPGYNGADQSPGALVEAARDIGFPVIIKAVAGGGGKGMRIVQADADFEDQLAACKGEALRAFGNDHVLVEKYINAPRHVEVQVFSDTHGNHVHLFDRDCSIQRRHQKIIEEAPAPGIPDAVREKMYAAAVQAAKAVDYVGAGTIEFIMDAQTFDFYFMEMNTRLQVEHPVTEEITGVDLVRWQLLVALGEEMPLEQEEITQSGHAIEVRLYAEDPENGFLPSTGRLDVLELLLHNGNCRVESGVDVGNEITPFYDPMIAKIVGIGADRLSATQSTVYALSRTDIRGLQTNRAFLSRVLSHSAFERADLTTGFLAQYGDDLKPPTDAPDEIYSTAAIACIVDINTVSLDRTGFRYGWRPTRLNGPQSVTMALQYGAQTPRRLEVKDISDGLYDVDGKVLPVLIAWEGNLQLDGEDLEHVVSPKAVEIRFRGQTYVFNRPDALHGKDAVKAGAGAVTAPMPGSVLSLSVEQGADVEAGDTLMVLEAMKMEHRLTAPIAGVVTAMRVAAGDQVRDGDILIEIEAP